jgi:hypothetical protein
MNNTIADNSALISGGGIFSSDSIPVVKNSILWGNSAGEDPQIGVEQGGVVVSFCNIQGGWINLYILDEDPRFRGPAQDDYHISWMSPCINRGTLDGAPARDADGQPRPYLGLVDMGAYEYHGTHPLEASDYTIHESQGCVLDFYLDASEENGGRNYLLLGSVTGIWPCTPLPGGSTTLPIYFDYFTETVLGYLNTPLFFDFYSSLDASGSKTAQMDTQGPLPSCAAGHTLYFAFCLGYPWEFASNPIAVEILP